MLTSNHREIDLTRIIFEASMDSMPLYFRPSNGDMTHPSYFTVQHALAASGGNPIQLADCVERSRLTLSCRIENVIKLDDIGLYLRSNRNKVLAIIYCMLCWIMQYTLNSNEIQWTYGRGRCLVTVVLPST